ncbi:Exportin-4 [Chytriomyces hyalinus]|nr:Exportin-4 [Chytriomyces hyalinus]
MSLPFDAQVQSILSACSEMGNMSRNTANFNNASNAIEALKDSPDALRICSHILEHAEDPTTLFFIANVTKDVIIRHYSSFSLQTLVALRGELMTNLLSPRFRNPSFKADVINSAISKMAQAIAVIVKRTWLEDAIQEDRKHFFVNLEALRRSGNLFNKNIALTVLDQMLGEFSSEATAFGLPWDFHSACRKSFEETELPRLFHMTMESLHEYTLNSSLLQDKGELTCSRKCVAIAVKIMNWEFVSLGNVMAGSFAKLEKPDNADGSGRFPSSWTPALVRPEVVETVFKIHDILLPYDISGNSAKLILYLAAVNGPVFPDFATQSGFITFFLERLETLITNFHSSTTHAQTNSMRDASGDELIAISSIIKRVLSTHSLNSLSPIAGFFKFMSSVVRHTLFSIDCMKSALSLGVDENSPGMIATDVMLEMWAQFGDQATSAIQMAPAGDAFTSTLTNFLQTLSLPIFTSHLEMRLALAERQVLDEADFEDEMGMEDEVAYADQLDHLTIIARWDAEGCLRLLHGLIQEAVNGIQGVLGGQAGEGASQTRQVLLERVHWLVLISEHVLADAADGEVPMVPETLMAVSSKAASAEVDIVVAVSSLIFQILSVFSNVEPGSPMMEFCSPLIVETLFVFLNRWSRTYLFINPSDYGQMSPWLGASYSAHGGGGQLFDFMLLSAKQNFALWRSEESVLNAVIGLLQSFAVRGVARDRMIQSGHFQELVGAFVSNIKDMPTSTHSPMIRVLASVSTQGSNPEVEANYFNELTGMLKTRLNSVVLRPDFARIFQSAPIKNEVVNILEMYEGLCLAADYNTAGTIFNCLIPYLDSFGKLFKLYKNITEVNLYVLRVFCEISKMLGLHEAAFEERRTFYASYTGVLKVYSNTNIGVRSIAMLDEEDRLDDLSCVLETLSNLILVESKDEDRDDVVFFGVNMVLPLITNEMIQYPSISQKALELVGNVVRHFPSKLLDLDIEELDKIMGVLRLGTTESFVIEVQKLSFEAIIGVVRYCVLAVRKGENDIQAIYPSMDITLQHLLDYMLFKEFDPDLIESVGEALYMLVLLRHDSYTVLAKQLLESQPTQERRVRLEAAFRTLTGCIEVAAVAGQASGNAILSFSEYKLYSEGLLKFLMEVRGFLRIRAFGVHVKRSASVGALKHAI